MKRKTIIIVAVIVLGTMSGLEVNWLIWLHRSRKEAVQKAEVLCHSLGIDLFSPPEVKFRYPSFNTTTGWFGPAMFVVKYKTLPLTITLVYDEKWKIYEYRRHADDGIIKGMIQRVIPTRQESDHSKIASFEEGIKIAKAYLEILEVPRDVTMFRPNLEMPLSLNNRPTRYVLSRPPNGCYGHSLLVMTESGELKVFGNAFWFTTSISLKPKVSKEQAEEIIRTKLNTGPDTLRLQVTWGPYLWGAIDEIAHFLMYRTFLRKQTTPPFALCWVVGEGPTEMYVDAVTGKILKR